MNNLATQILLAGIAVIGLLALFAAFKAESAIFAFHMCVIVVWAIAFSAFTVMRSKCSGC